MKEAKAASTADDIFSRLQRRGIDYARIKAVLLDIPHEQLFFARNWSGKSFGQLLTEMDRQRALLEKLWHNLPGWEQLNISHASMRARILQQVLIVNQQVGNWTIQTRYILHPILEPSDTRSHAWPSLCISVLDRCDGSTRQVVIPPESFETSAKHAEALERAMKELGIWEELQKNNPAVSLLSKRSGSGWPLFTQLIIPRLYELMQPHYEVRANYSERLDGAQCEPQRSAIAPKELLRDMLDVLTLEFPQEFGQYKLSALKTAISRYVQGKESETALGIF
jgi:hypothetical protein